MKGVKEPDTIVAVAINVRRIFILPGITLLLSLWTTWYSLFVIDFFRYSRLTVFLWGVGATIIVAGGLWYAIKMKRVTTLQSHPILFHREFS